MDAKTLQRITEVCDISEISQLVVKERQARDLGRWHEMQDCFHADAVIRLSWFSGLAADFVAGSIDMARRGVLAKHRLGPVFVRLAGVRALASLGGTIDIPTIVGTVSAQLSSHARFLYRAERRSEGDWRLSGLDVIYIRDELLPAIPGQSLPVLPEHLERFRGSYRFLSYVMSLQNYEINASLPGDDRPDLSESIEKECFEWAGIAR